MPAMTQSHPNTAAPSTSAARSARVDFPVPGGPVSNTTMALGTVTSWPR